MPKKGQKGPGKPFLEWCAENGKRGERLANEFREELPTELTKGSRVQGEVEVFEVQARVAGEGVPPHVQRHTHRVSELREAKRRRAKTNNFLTWCEKPTASRGKKLPERVRRPGQGADASYEGVELQGAVEV